MNEIDLMRKQLIFIRELTVDNNHFLGFRWLMAVFSTFQFSHFEGITIQWNPVNTDTKGAGQIVRINGVSVLSGVSEKSHGYMFFRRKDKGKRFYGFYSNCNR